MRFIAEQLGTQWDFEAERILSMVTDGDRVALIVEGYFVKPERGRYEYMSSRLYRLTVKVTYPRRSLWSVFEWIERCGSEYVLEEVKE